MNKSQSGESLERGVSDQIVPALCLSPWRQNPQLVTQRDVESDADFAYVIEFDLHPAKYLYTHSIELQVPGNVRRYSADVPNSFGVMSTRAQLFGRICQLQGESSPYSRTESIP